MAKRVLVKGDAPFGSVEYARCKAGLQQPVGYRDRYPHVNAIHWDIDRSERAPAGEGGMIGELRKMAQEVDGNAVRLVDPRPRKTGKRTGNKNGRRGVREATPRILKELIFIAMDMVGRDGRGKDKAAGYLARIAIKHPDIFGRFIEKLIPYTLSGPGGGPVEVNYNSKDAIIQRMKERGMPIPKQIAGPDGQLKGAPENGEPTGLEAGLEAGVVQSLVEAPIQEDITKRDGERGEILPPEDFSGYGIEDGE